MLIFHEIFEALKNGPSTPGKPQQNGKGIHRRISQRKRRRCNRLIFKVSNLSRYKRRIIYDLCCISDSRFYNSPDFLCSRIFRLGTVARDAAALYARGKKARESRIVYRPISIDASEKSCARSWNFRPRS